MSRDEFKEFLRDALAGDPHVEQDIYIEDAKLDIVTDKFFAIVDRERWGSSSLNNAKNVVTVNVKKEPKSTTFVPFFIEGGLHA